MLLGIGKVDANQNRSTDSDEASNFLLEVTIIKGLFNSAERNKV